MTDASRVIDESVNAPLETNLELFPINPDMQMEQYALMVHFQNLVNTYGNDLVFEFIKNQVRIYEELMGGLNE